MGSLSLIYLVICGGLSIFFYYVAVIQEYKKDMKEYNKKIDYIKFTKESNITIFDTISNSDYSQKITACDSENLTDFQKELRSNTKTPQQILNKKIRQEKEQILQTVHNDYLNIKNKLKENVSNGIYYSDDNNLKYTSIKYECKYLLQCIERKYSDCPTGRIGYRNYYRNSQLKYRILKKEQYKYYLKKLREYAKKDNIIIMEFFVAVKTRTKPETEIMLPYIFKSETEVMNHAIKVYLKCSINY